MHRLAHGLAGGKVDDAVDTWIVGEKLAQCVDIGTIALDKDGALARDVLNAVEHLDVAVRKIVDNHDLVACILQLYGGV